ncbi:MAG TPA: alkaline phosphatase [Bacteroidales bacterium]|nr:alkaline phosphatase [Bacteroidales bacterium]
MRNAVYKLFILIIIVLVSGCAENVGNESGRSEKKPKNIIIFIGDGMGVAQLYAGMTKSGKAFFLERFPYSGFSKTYSADAYITDSAAGGTAIACGEKTNNGMIGVRPDSTLLVSITELAHKNGLAAGVVSTSAVTHATPASFVAHNAGRGNYEEIANDFLKGTIDVFIGGGENHFRNRKDGADLTDQLKEQGFDVVYTPEDMKKSQSAKLAGLLAKEHMPKASEGRNGLLTDMTKKAIETLSRNKNGFVLLVEGSMIDWGAHENNLDYVTSETIDLDQAIGAALDFATADRNTLVFVTADHETGGLVLTGGDVKTASVEGKFAGSDHSAVMVPVFTYGPGAEKFSGIHENTFFYGEFTRLLGLKTR